MKKSILVHAVTLAVLAAGAGFALEEKGAAYRDLGALAASLGGREPAGVPAVGGSKELSGPGGIPAPNPAPLGVSLMVVHINDRDTRWDGPRSLFGVGPLRPQFLADGLQGYLAFDTTLRDGLFRSRVRRSGIFVEPWTCRIADEGCQPGDRMLELVPSVFTASTAVYPSRIKLEPLPNPTVATVQVEYRVDGGWTRSFSFRLVVTPRYRTPK